MKEYPFIFQLIEKGYAVSLNDTGPGKKSITVCDEGVNLIMFYRRRMNGDKLMEKLEKYSRELLEDGIANDEINGERTKIW